LPAPHGAAWSFSRWGKMNFKEREHGFHVPELAAYLCRAYDERRPGARLASFTLVDHALPPRPPGGQVAEAHDRILGHATCPGQS
jgi:hypothetical protein